MNLSEDQIVNVRIDNEVVKCRIISVDPDIACRVSVCECRDVDTSHKVLRSAVIEIVGHAIHNDEAYLASIREDNNTNIEEVDTAQESLDQIKAVLNDISDRGYSHDSKNAITNAHELARQLKETLAFIKASELTTQANMEA